MKFCQRFFWFFDCFLLSCSEHLQHAMLTCLSSYFLPFMNLRNDARPSQKHLFLSKFSSVVLKDSCHMASWHWYISKWSETVFWTDCSVMAICCWQMIKCGLAEFPLFNVCSSHLFRHCGNIFVIIMLHSGIYVCDCLSSSF